jgi:hypothetical protein
VEVQFGIEENIMKKTVVFVMMLLLAATYSFAEEATGEWTKFTSADKSYSVMFPGQPKEQVVKEEYTNTVMQVLSFPGKLVFISGYTDYKSMPDVQGELIADRDNFLKQTSAKLTSSKLFEFERAPNDMLPAIMFTGEGTGRSYRGIFIVDKPRTYMFCIGEVSSSISSGNLRFLDSARLYKVAK